MKIDNDLETIEMLAGVVRNSYLETDFRLKALGKIIDKCLGIIQIAKTERQELGRKE